MRLVLGIPLLLAYLLLALLPVLSLLFTALQGGGWTITGLDSLPPPTIANFQAVLADPAWYEGFVAGSIQVATTITVTLIVALPAAYAFSRYRFVGDRQLFFWLFANWAAPVAAFLLPVSGLYAALGLFDTHVAVALAHCLFTLPVAVWILEGALSAVPPEIDETAYLEGYNFPHFFLVILLPQIKGGIGIAIFFCFLLAWGELLLARTLTASNTVPFVVTLTERLGQGTATEPGLIAAAAILAMLPGLAVLWFVRRSLARGFALGRI